MINTNLPPILHRFRDIALDMSKSLYLATPLAFNAPPPDGGVPWDDLRKIFCRCQRMAKVPNGVEILPKFSTGWVGCTTVTDRQTTDGRATAYSERWKCTGYCVSLHQVCDNDKSNLDQNYTVQYWDPLGGPPNHQFRRKIRCFFLARVRTKTT